jgi:hypothetical protein
VRTLVISAKASNKNQLWLIQTETEFKGYWVVHYISGRHGKDWSPLAPNHTAAAAGH